MFQEITIIFTSQNINLYPSYTQFYEEEKKALCGSLPTAVQDCTVKSFYCNFTINLMEVYYQNAM